MKKDFFIEGSVLALQKMIPVSDRIPLHELWDLRKKTEQLIYHHPKEIGIIDFDYFLKYVHIKYNHFPAPHSVRFLNLHVADHASSVDKDWLLVRGKGRPQNWLINLLIYELSEAGMKNMEIAKLIFGVNSSTENWPDETKHPVLVKIATIKRAIEKTVSKAYPF